MSRILKINILVVEYIIDNKFEAYYKIYNFYGHINKENLLPLCILEYNQRKQHFDLLYYNNDFIESNNNILKNEEDSNKIDINNIQRKKSQDSISHKSKSESNNYESNNNEENINSNIKDKTAINLNDKNIKKNFENVLSKSNNNLKEIDKAINNNYKIDVLKQKDNNNINKSQKIENNDYNIIINKILEILKKERFSIKELEERKSDININLHKPSDYPIYPLNYEDPEGYYSNIYNYLYLRQLNPHGENYPSYIYNIKDSTKKETRKRAFRRSATNYLIDNFGNLCIKKYDNEIEINNEEENDNNNKEEKDNITDEENENNFENENVIVNEEESKIENLKDNLKEKNYRNKNNYTLYVIPYKINEYELIKNIHRELNHRNSEDIRKELIRRKIYYYGYTNDIKYIISKCPICL